MLLGYIQKKSLSIHISTKLILHKIFYLLKDRHDVLRPCIKQSVRVWGSGEKSPN